MKLDFDKFKTAINRQYHTMLETGLFCTRVEKDGMWITYIDSFPEGTNPMFRERTEHDCSCCKSFIRTIGDLVTIVDGKVISIWDAEIEDPSYRAVAKAMSQYVKGNAISNQFLHYEPVVGTDVNHEVLEDGRTLQWKHFSLELPTNRNSGKNYVKSKKDIGPILSEVRANHDVLLRSLSELTRDAVDTVTDLIKTNTLYRGAESKGTMAQFDKLKKKFDLLPVQEQDLFVWSKLDEVGIAVSRIRNTSLGTLLIDLSGEPARAATGDEPAKPAKPPLDLEDAVRKYEKVMAPENYKRPVALVTPKMVEAARAEIEESGLTSALERRFARLRDIKVPDVLFANRDARTKMIGDVFDLVPTKKADPKTLAKVESIGIEKFLADILPGAESVEVMMENKHTSNLVSLIAPVHDDAKPLFLWENGFSWAYRGDVTDSIKERVKAAGGNVVGELCCRLAWYNYDDLDFHLKEPGARAINYTNKFNPMSHGRLDVDMNAGHGTTLTPVENIFYPSRSRMREGVYELFVHNFRTDTRKDGEAGFEVEIDFMGDVTHYAYPKAVRGGQNITVAKWEYSHAKGMKMLSSLEGTTRNKTEWGVGTNEFHKVNTIMLSPNHWDGEKKIGNRHYFFMLADCIREDTARGFFNEFLRPDLTKHRKVLELVGSKVKTETSQEQLSGLGFSDTKRNDLLARVKGKSTIRTFKVQF